MAMRLASRHVSPRMAVLDKRCGRFGGSVPGHVVQAVSSGRAPNRAIQLVSSDNRRGSRRPLVVARGGDGDSADDTGSGEPFADDDLWSSLQPSHSRPGPINRGPRRGGSGYGSASHDSGRSQRGRGRGPSRGYGTERDGYDSPRGRRGGSASRSARRYRSDNWSRGGDWEGMDSWDRGVDSDWDVSYNPRGSRGRGDRSSRYQGGRGRSSQTRYGRDDRGRWSQGYSSDDSWDSYSDSRGRRGRGDVAYSDRAAFPSRDSYGRGGRRGSTSSYDSRTSRGGRRGGYGGDRDRGWSSRDSDGYNSRRPPRGRQEGYSRGRGGSRRPTNDSGKVTISRPEGVIPKKWKRQEPSQYKQTPSGVAPKSKSAAVRLDKESGFIEAKVAPTQDQQRNPVGWVQAQLDGDGRRRQRRSSQDAAMAILFASSMSGQEPLDHFKERLGSRTQEAQVPMMVKSTVTSVQDTSSLQIREKIAFQQGVSVQSITEVKEDQEIADREEALDEHILCLPLATSLGGRALRYTESLVTDAQENQEGDLRFIQESASSVTYIRGMCTIEVAILRTMMSAMRLGLEPDVALRGGVILGKVYASLQSPKFIYAMLEKFLNEVMLVSNDASTIDSMEQDPGAFAFTSGPADQPAHKGKGVVKDEETESSVKEWLGPIEAAASGFSDADKVFSVSDDRGSALEEPDSLRWLPEEEGLGFSGASTLDPKSSELENAAEEAAARAALARAAAIEAAAEAEAHEAEAEALAEELRSTKAGSDPVKGWEGVSVESGTGIVADDFEALLKDQSAQGEASAE
mmetsp:Transcript_1196/g.4229  ORF Transcript_1196/g.4229 Transcript_1196/m.4229 type:complete len:797 (+) Transcript_1196:256-2646(+)